MPDNSENSRKSDGYRQALFLDGEVITRGGTIQIPLRCLACKKEKLETMFKARLPEEDFRVESVTHPGSPSMHRMRVSFEPKSTDTAAITRLFVELSAAGVQDIERTTISKAFYKIGRDISVKPHLNAGVEGAAPLWAASVSPRESSFTDAGSKTGPRHF